MFNTLIAMFTVLFVVFALFAFVTFLLTLLLTSLFGSGGGSAKSFGFVLMPLDVFGPVDDGGNARLSLVLTLEKLGPLRVSSPSVGLSTVGVQRTTGPTRCRRSPILMSCPCLTLSNRCSVCVMCLV